MKKIHNILLASAAASMLLTGCAEDFDTSYPAGDKPESVAMADLTRGYEVLKNYTSMKLAANITVADLKASNTTFSTVLENFNAVNITDGFEHSAVAADDGTIDASSNNDVVQKAIDAGLIPCGSLFAPNAWNMNVMKEATKDIWVDGENVDLHQKFDFESSAIGDVFGFALMGLMGKAKDSKPEATAETGAYDDGQQRRPLVGKISLVIHSLDV